jgi:hypothetical protein
MCRRLADEERRIKTGVLPASGLLLPVVTAAPRPHLHVNDGEAMKPDMEISDDVIAGLR